METIKRRMLLMDTDWRFHRGDVPHEKIVEHMYTYDLCKTTRGHGPAAVSYPDEDWQRVRLPHDFLIEGEPSESENGIKGSYARPNGWYRRYFRIEAGEARHYALVFEGIATHSVIYLNGHLLYRSFSGYTSFEVDITDFIRTGEELNVLSVYVKNHESEGWWYEGAGIYRHVWLASTGEVRVDSWGTFVRTERAGEYEWKTRVETRLRNDRYEAARGELVSTICDEGGTAIGSARQAFEIPAREGMTVDQVIPVSAPRLWSLEAPRMHRLITRVYVDGELTDDYETPFGYRTLRYDPDEGFFLNDQPVKLKGVCAHQDHGGLGAAVPDSVQVFRVRALKGCGANALRTTHNPVAPSLLDACDREGMLVMEENRWLVSSDQRMGELEAMIRRDRNHPSIIFWSVFNEDAILDKPAGAKMFRAMYERAAKLDDTRAIIGAPVRNVAAEEYIRSSPVMGFNYNFEKVDMLYKCWHKPHVNTETHQGNYAGGNDGWRLAALRPYVMGIFIWGVETRGETYWPRLFAPWGIMDGMCYPKTHYELYRNSYWADRPSIKIVPMLDYPKILPVSPCWLNAKKSRMSYCWNPRQLEGRTVDVWVYTNLPRVELCLNGRSLGVKYADPFEQVCWQVPYEPGELVAVGMNADGDVIARDVLRTTGPAVSLAYELHNDRLLADGEDCAVITAYAVDAEGRFVPDADGVPVRFDVAEHGTLLAASNSDPTDHRHPTDSDAYLWNGRCQLIVRSDDQPGDLVIRASSPQLGNAEWRIPRAAAAPVPRVEPAESCFISTVKVGNYFEALEDPFRADARGEIQWTTKRFDKRLFTDMPVGFNVLPYRLEVRLPETASPHTGLFFEHLVGRIHIQVVDESGDCVLELRDENRAERYTLDLSQFEPGSRLTIYVATEIDPPTYHGPNPYWRFIGMYGIARWVHKK
ncbi:MAG: glycoside hydrolase family 2 TIM barrel-domain containing protein [Clostridia bacterium]|nr:glycoside hydrolase family 2 TIM barrel-domain containing protein [Clostridia bacterium]